MSVIYSDEQLLEELRRLDGELERSPTQRDMTQFGEFGKGTYFNRFGTWNNALREAGLEINEEQGVSREDLINELKTLREELGRVPKIRDLREMGTYSISNYYRKFDSWNSVLEHLGWEQNKERDIPETELINELHRLREEVGHPPRANDMMERGEYSYSVYYERFGTWNNALLTAGFETWEHPSGEDNPAWNGGRSEVYGNNWPKQRERCRKRDDYKCRVCGKNEDDLEIELSVHHITPRRHYISGNTIDEERANQLTNLVTLCPSCHREYEWTHIFSDVDSWKPIQEGGGE